MTDNQGNRVKAVRKHFKLSQQELADGIGIKQSSISNIEKIGSASSEVMIKIAEVYKVNLDWLVSGKGEMLKKHEPDPKPSNHLEIAERMADRVRDDYKQRIEELQDHIKTLKLSNAEYRGLLQKNKILS